MADGLFFIQRYLGSDDEDSVDFTENNKDTESISTSKEKHHELKRKKQHLSETSGKEIQNHSISNTDDDIQYLNETNYKILQTNSSEEENKPSNEKKSKKLSKKSSNDLISVEEKHFEPKRKKQRLSETAGKEVQNHLISNTDDDIRYLNETNHKTSQAPSSEEENKSSNEKKSKKLPKKSSNDLISVEDYKKSDKDIRINSQNETKNDSEAFCTIGQIKDKNIEKIKPVLPKWLNNPSIIGIDLEEYKNPISDVPYLDDVSKKNLQEAGISFLFPVQSAVIPWLLQNNQHCLSTRPSDLCVSAPTGSGKTLAFVLPIVQSLKSRTVTAVRALVVLPVGELAIQVYKVFEMFVQDTDLKVVLLTGQKSFAAEQNALVKQGIRRTLSLVDIIVTTPGRILDHISRTKGFSLQHLRFLVIDEADRMMDDIQKGWLKQIENAVYSNCHSNNCLCFSAGGVRIPFMPSSACHFGYINEPLQKLLYSATLSHDPEKLHTLSLYKPKLFTTEAKSEGWIGKCSIPENLTLYYAVCKSDTKPLVLCHFIKKNQFKKVLCFMDSIERAQRLHFILEEMGILRVREISSINTPVTRKIILEQFSAGKLDLLVCSDLVARGIDIEDVDCVISYDVPLHIKRYVHRIGRTARAGKRGTALTLLTEVESSSFKKILKSAGMPVPTHIDVANKDLEVYVESFKNALTIADSKIRKIKANARNHPKVNKEGKILKKSRLQKSSQNSQSPKVTI
ncbi:ATP-dependent RNA helicase DDX51 [Araneus ventricosus]|uniref:ATP-dependent RNA helicase n=1 Tax=Araneus ventricosus TaxID=182803 RepID=A0A4Y2JSM0_ARAVE|nr:ATP-dependent RNA helicase DDX51 [Araneus ventricosus]